MNRRTAAMSASLGLIMCGGVSANAPTEPDRTRFQVDYGNGDTFAVECRDDQCVVKLRVASEVYEFDSLELKAMPVASDGMLYSVDTLPGSFGFEIEVTCTDFVATEGRCHANYSVDAGQIVEIHKYTRVVGPISPEPR